MKKFFVSCVVLFCGLLTAALVAYANARFSTWTGIDIYRVSLLYVLPAGAFACGLLGALGFSLSAIRLHRRPNATLGWQMVFASIAIPLMSYWWQYQGLTLDDGPRVADFLPFASYLDDMLARSHLIVKMNDFDAPGRIGYLVGAFQLLGVIIGALSILLFLQWKPWCEPCDLYLDDSEFPPKTRVFKNEDAARVYYGQLPALKPGSLEYTQLIASDTGLAKEEGSYLIETRLYACPGCKTQALLESAQSHDGTKWRLLSDMRRLMLLPAGVNLGPLFKAA